MGYYQAFFTALLSAIIFLIIAIPTWLTLVWELLSKSWTERILESANAKHHITWSSTAKKKQWLRAKRKARKVALTPYLSPCMLCLNPTVIAALLRSLVQNMLILQSMAGWSRFLAAAIFGLFTLPKKKPPRFESTKTKPRLKVAETSKKSLAVMKK